MTLRRIAGPDREATVYLTAQTGARASNRLWHTTDIALCATDRDGLDLAS